MPLKEKLKKKLKYPVIIKPNAEGSSKGISDFSIAYNEIELYKIMNDIFNKYKCTILVEEYIRGREFTVGVIGNGDNIEILPIMEIIFRDNNADNLYSYRVKKESETSIYCECPASIGPTTWTDQLRSLTIEALSRPSVAPLLATPLTNLIRLPITTAIRRLQPLSPAR